MIVDRRLLFVGILFVVFVLVGCSDSGNNDHETPPSNNPEQVIVGETAQLTAFASEAIGDDLDRNDLTFQWELVSKPQGSQATLSNPDSPIPTFIPDIEGTYVLKLTIFYQGQFLTELEIHVVALPQETDTHKPGNHIASDDNCSACHLPDSWVPATVDHDHVIGECSSCHQQPAGHIATVLECHVCHDTKSWDADRAMLMASKALWERNNIAKYQFQYSCSCFPADDLVITVADGVVIEAYYASSGDLVPEQDLIDLVTVNRLFALIEDTIDIGAMLTVTYNFQYGYPQNIVIGDTEKTTYTVKDFKIIETPPPNPDQVQFDENRMLWQEAGITDYQYTYQISCFCGNRENVVVVVKGGVIVEAYFTPSGSPLTPTEINNYQIKTIPQLFSLIQEEIDRPADRLEVSYDSVLGYPQIISVDHQLNVADDEYVISVLDFQEIFDPPVTPPDDPAQIQLDKNKALWQQANIADYRYIYHIACSCPFQEDIVVVVRFNKVVEAFFTPSGKPLTPEQIKSNNLRTVDQLFTVIQNEIDRPAAELSVTYNAALGYPQEISVDPYAELQDDQYAMTVSDFQDLAVPSPQDPRQAQLDENLALWQQAGITKYQFTYRAACMCPPREDAVLTVEDGVITKAYFTPSNTPLTPEQIVYMPTIEDIFDIIQNAINQNAYMLNITYNKQLGYPELTSIDYVQIIADEEIYYLVMDFQSLK